VSFTDLDWFFHKSGTIDNNEIWIQTPENMFKISIIHAKGNVSANPRQWRGILQDNILEFSWRG
jgi:hypothetical protein